MKVCKNCGQEVDKKAIVCVNCGASLKVKKPVFKKWWFWAVIVVVLIIVIASGSGDKETTNNNDKSNDETVNTQVEEKTYEVVDLQTMLDALKDNAMKAEKDYQNKYVEVTGKISSFDSDGSYISIEPVNADEWNFDTVMCYIKDDTQKDLLLQKSKGDVVTIKGKIKSIGEVLGYSLNIDEVV